MFPRTQAVINAALGQRIGRLKVNHQATVYYFFYNKVKYDKCFPLQFLNMYIFE